jgi:hypothetical protein
VDGTREWHPVPWEGAAETDNKHVAPAPPAAIVLNNMIARMRVKV